MEFKFKSGTYWRGRDKHEGTAWVFKIVSLRDKEMNLEWVSSSTGIKTSYQRVFTGNHLIAWVVNCQLYQLTKSQYMCIKYHWTNNI